MDFIKRYEELSAYFSSERTPPNERLEYVDRDEVMEMLLGFGYTSRRAVGHLFTATHRCELSDKKASIWYI